MAVDPASASLREVKDRLRGLLRDEPTLPPADAEALAQLERARGPDGRVDLRSLDMRVLPWALEGLGKEQVRALAVFKHLWQRMSHLWRLKDHERVS